MFGDSVSTELEEETFVEEGAHRRRVMLVPGPKTLQIKLHAVKAKKKLLGVVVLICRLWPVSAAVWVFVDRDTFRTTRIIIGSPHASFGRKDLQETRCTTSAPVFVGTPHGSFNLDARRLPADQPPHFKHQSVASRKPNWCER